MVKRCFYTADSGSSILSRPTILGIQMSAILSKEYVAAMEKHRKEIQKTLCPNAQRIAQFINNDFIKNNPMPSIIHKDGSVETAF